MVKINGQQASKSVLVKDKLCEVDLDKLVIDTSRKVTHDGFHDQLTNNNTDGTRTDQMQDNLVGDHKINDYNRLNQPKRPMNAFMVWGQAIRRELHKRFSNVQNASLSKALGRVWRVLDASEKEPYIRKANLIKADHKRDYPNYRYQPRRIQERRNKSNMLIGINLNHPVNQNPHLVFDNNSNIKHFNVNQIGCTIDNSAQRYQPELLHSREKPNYQDSVQKIEYQPYSINVQTDLSSRNEPISFQQINLGQNYRTSTSYLDSQNMNNFNQQDALVRKPQHDFSNYSYHHPHQYLYNSGCNYQQSVSEQPPIVSNYSEPNSHNYYVSSSERNMETNDVMF